MMLKKFKFAFGLIEVMIASSLLAIVLLSAASIQSQSLNLIRSSSLRATAINMINQLSNFILIMNNEEIENMSQLLLSMNIKNCASNTNIPNQLAQSINCVQPIELYAYVYRTWQNSVNTLFSIHNVVNVNAQLGGLLCKVTINNNNKLRIIIKWLSLSGKIESEYLDHPMDPTVNLLGYPLCPI